MEITAKSFFGSLPKIPEIKLNNAAHYIQAGLKNFFGENYIRNEAQDKVADWLSDNKGKGLLLMGSYGTGKTILATRIVLPLVKWYMENKKDWYSGFGMYVYSAYEMKEAFERNFHVCIDDVGMENFEKSYGSTTDYFTRLIDNAERRALLLICTTNLSVNELKEKYGERTFDRMKKLMRPVVFSGESLRK